ncbi:hypothetical protein TELCIR_14279 [Teladorsagia circumcincta]|uniref:Uncharacterized protein n=1 Tax=Teladorsagia circumcincta TaxID=45464 RepID=A0A2G9U1N8_TELCI|nr:hypothetical protein TELCIR_14279 [Teladorsagia circumcincta]
MVPVNRFISNFTSETVEDGLYRTSDIVQQYSTFSARQNRKLCSALRTYRRSRLLLRSGLAKSSAKDEYLMGGHNMPSIPVALSLLTTFLSGILMLAVPAEMFQREFF